MVYLLDSLLTEEFAVVLLHEVQNLAVCVRIPAAGQTVDLQDSKVVVDGQALDEDYTTGMSWPLSVQAPGAQVSYPYTVPDGCVWVMGDNRENSADSRYFGPVDRSDLIAVALVRYWPLNRIGAID